MCQIITVLTELSVCECVYIYHYDSELCTKTLLTPTENTINTEIHNSLDADTVL